MSAISQIFAGLNRTPLTKEDGTVSWPWQKGITQLAQAVNAPALSGNIPTASDSQGSAGQIATDGTFLYVCIATNSWLRAALSTF
jgi:hypothetical protein